MKSILFIFIFLLPTGLLGQKAKMVFEDTSHAMGIVQENGEKVAYPFKFVNKGKAPLIIKHVESSCGCTVPKWPRHPILPLDSGVITVTFNPKDRAGVFTKKIIVYTNATPPNIVLKIEGEVVTVPVDVAKVYPFAAGDLRINTDTIHLPRVKETQQIVNLINTGKKPISIESLVKPGYLDIHGTPLILKKGMKGDLIIRYVPRRADTTCPTDQVWITTSQGIRFRFTLSNQ